ncbi:MULTISPECIES: MFS transporter [unclassified Nocardia]|uniref:MFS transporter n=1 Tax=unclassified Nocardia TaxID=2637762 RepID=UPI001CE46DEE|nr:MULTISPECIES: MFS transporter [unclassified Nocardia]
MRPTVAEAEPRRSNILLRHRNFRLFWLGETISTLGSQMVVVVVPLIALEVLHTGTLAVGLLQSCLWLPWFVIGLPVGAWVDRHRKRPIMLVADIVAFLAFVSIAIMAWTGTVTIAELAITLLIGGAAQVFFTAAYQPYLKSLLAGPDRAEGNSILEASATAAQVGGPGVGGVVSQLFGAVTGMFINGLTFAYSALCLVRIPPHEPAREPSDGPRTSLRTEIKDGVVFVAKNPYLRTMTLYEGLGNIGDAMMMAVAIVFLVQTIGVNAGVAGVLVAITNIGGILGAMATPRLCRRLGTARALLLAVAVSAPFTLLIPLSFHGGGLTFFVVGSAVYLAGISVANVVLGTFVQSYVPERLLARCSAVFTLLNKGCMPLGSLIGAVLGSVYGPRTALLVVGIVITLSTGALLIGPVRHRRDLPTEPLTGGEYA